jgi:hypothetical protein
MSASFALLLPAIQVKIERHGAWDKKARQSVTRCSNRWSREEANTAFLLLYHVLIDKEEILCQKK